MTLHDLGERLDLLVDEVRRERADLVGHGARERAHFEELVAKVKQEVRREGISRRGGGVVDRGGAVVYVFHSRVAFLSKVVG